MKIDQLLNSIQHLSPAQKEMLISAMQQQQHEPQQQQEQNDFAARIQREVPSWNADEYRAYRNQFQG